MRHAWYRRRFSRALDGDLTPRAQQRLQQHLEHCAGCRKAFAELRGTVRLLHDVAAVKPPSTDMSAQIMARISAAPAPWYGRLAPPAPALLPALGGALALAVVVFWPLPGGEPGASGPAGRAGNSAPAVQVVAQTEDAPPSPDAAVQLAESRTPAAQTAPPAGVATGRAARRAPAVQVVAQTEAAPPSPDAAVQLAESRTPATQTAPPAGVATGLAAVPAPRQGASSGLAPADGPLPKPLSPALVRPVTTGAPGRRALPTPPMPLGFAEGAGPAASRLGREPAALRLRAQRLLETALQQPLVLVERLERIRDDARRERAIEGLARFAAERGVSQQLAEKLRATEDARALELAERFETPEGAPDETPEGAPPATP